MNSSTDVVVVAHDPNWATKFAVEAKAIAGALGPAEIHHVGSTSVPGIHAKPIVDILVEAASLEVLETRADAMKELGYEAKGEFGIPGRRYFRKDDDAGVRQFHVHAFAMGATEIVRHLAFRDYLRAHPVVAEGYSRLKRQLANQHAFDNAAYVDGKDPFIKRVERDALAWRQAR